ncbi:MAG: FG-GAP-like repeat-containing protein, partial [Planctomycetota bacterium]|nr:FG-GAP-like repeat-containing protein [Planctomycetota bacterium]
AHEVFTQLAQAHPNWLDVQVNLAIATLNRQAEGDDQNALEILTWVLERDSSNLRAHYCSGLLKLHLQSSEEAARHFEFVANTDESDAYAAYYVGQSHFQSRQYEKAVTWFETSLALDNFLRSAYYALGRACHFAGQSDRAGVLLEQFQRLENNPRSRLVEFKYTRMGPKGETYAIDQVRPERAPFPEGDLFTIARPLIDGADEFIWNDEPRDRPVSITACDLNGDGNLDLFIADALRHGDSVNNAVIINNGDGTFALDTDHILASVSFVNAALWGDYDNDGLTDVYLCRRGSNQLWRQIETNVWRDVTSDTGTANEGYDTVDGAMFDADHDGDLDIFCVNADGPNELLNNNLDGTFRAIAQDQGLAGDGRSSRQVLVTDLDRDLDADIIVINDVVPHEVYINDRGWSYRSDDAFDDFIDAKILAASAADVNADGLVELYTQDSEGHVSRWQGDRGEDWTRHDMHPDDQVATPLTHQLALCDINGDGQINIMASAGPSWQVVKYQVSPGFYRPFTPHGQGDLLCWAMFNVGCGYGSSVVGLPKGGGPILWDPGAGRFDSLTLSLTGLEDKGKATRSNASGIGAFLQARIDSHWIALDTFRNASGPGQSLQPITIGSLGHSSIDFIKLDWSDGVLQTELHDVAYVNKDKVQRLRDFTVGGSSGCETIEEIQRLTSSCPVLFAWNGEKFQFVSDVLGVGGLGFMLAPGEYNRPRPWENLMLPDGLLKARDGRFALKIGEPMQEACYLDAARLVAYDLPPGWSMILDERSHVMGPAPTGEARYFRKSMSPSRVINDRNQDVTATLLGIDQVAPPIGPLDLRFIGRLENDHVLTLTFDEPIDADAGVPMLIAQGWIEYPYSQTMFAAWQAGASYNAPSIEARDEDGEWVVVLEQFGYPAGMPKPMSVPLANLPKGTRELRITSNVEVYWDQIRIAWAEDCSRAKRIELPMAESTLQRQGFARHTVGPQSYPNYDYDQRSTFWDTKAQTGQYTSFGRVDALVSQADDALAIFGPGEEVHLEFRQLDDEVQEGWTRVYVLESEGWCKDRDLYTRDGRTLGPIPKQGSGTSDRQKLHTKFNTRMVVSD